MTLQTTSSAQESDVFNPEKRHWDYIIVGTGIGGATLGYALAKAGKSVLFCEQGYSCTSASHSLTGDYAEQFFPVAKVADTDNKAILAQSGRYTDVITDASLPKIKRYIPFIGAGTGGSSALYGAAMERFLPEDFEPKQWHPGAADSLIPEKWPISYAEMQPFYEQAEALYHVHATDSPFPPPPLSPANQVLSNFLEKKGLHPYRLPIACEFSAECQSCQGYLCANNCKNDSVKIGLKPAIEQYGATLLSHCKVDSLITENNKITGLLADWQGQKIQLQGQTVILAAGALATPVLLLRSVSQHFPKGLANTSGMVGKNLMRHFVDMYVMLSGKKPNPSDNTKEIAFNDFYLAKATTKDTINKLGSVQSFGWMPPSDMLVESLEHDIRQSTLPIASVLFKGIKPLMRPLLNHLLCRRLVLASTLEDLPYMDNGVVPDGDQGIRFHYHVHAYDQQRIAHFRQTLKTAFQPQRFMLIKQAENNERLAHVCGTCRMGDDPATSVVNKYNRSHTLSNLFIVDSSFFPSSGGTNPSLTIAANALRVAAHIIQSD